MTSLSRSASTLRYLTDLLCFTQAMVFPISLPLRKPTCCSPRLIRVRTIMTLDTRLNAKVNANWSSTDLVTWCENENVPFVTFRDWSSITQTVKDIAAGTVSVKDAARGRI